MTKRTTTKRPRTTKIKATQGTTEPPKQLRIMRADLAQAFDRWLDDYTNNPEKFEQIVATVKRHSAERVLGQTPTYGQDCTETLVAYLQSVVATRVLGKLGDVLHG